MTARVLVVDDLLPNIKLLEARLTAEYFDVLTSTNGPEAIEACKAGLCDIVLLDIMMPGMDGFEVCTRLKADPTTSHIPVVMVTALDQPSDRKVAVIDCARVEEVLPLMDRFGQVCDHRPCTKQVGDL
mgnify:CR=1 FL=1